MNTVTEILAAAESGDPRAAEALMPLVYDELRRMAAHRLASEPRGHTLQPTALVHEVFLRLAGPANGPAWNSRGHFFAAAAEAMRRILVEAARRRTAAKRGGGAAPLDVLECAVQAPAADEHLLAVHEVLDQLSTRDPQAAELVKLRFFAGLSAEEAAGVLGMSVRGAHDVWTYARAWLRDRLTPP